MTARRALAAGWLDLWRWPALTTLALLAAVVGEVAVRAAAVRAGQLWGRALVDLAGTGEHFFAYGWRALAVWLAGTGLAALLVDATRAAALVAFSSAAPPDRRLVHAIRPLLLGLSRTPFMISVRAVELLIYFALGLGNLFVLVRVLPGSAREPARQALATALCLAPSLLLAVITFLAARVAQALIARGFEPAPALAHGLDATLRHFGSLVALGLFGLLVTAPFLVGGALLPFGLAAACYGLATLWMYAALAVWVGRDGRALTG